jgi:hypothetical protein
MKPTSLLVLPALALLAACQQPLRFHDPEHRGVLPSALAPFADHREFAHPPTKLAAIAASAEEEAEFDRLQVIEFDDEGELWERPTWLAPRNSAEAIAATAPGATVRPSQFERTLAAVRLARARCRNLTVVVFVHGWKHDANRTDYVAEVGNLAEVARFVKLRNDQHRKADEDTRLLGISIAWRGTPWNALRSLTPGGDVVSALNAIPLNLTLWNRLATAERVGRPAATQVVLTLAGEAKRLDVGPPDNPFAPARVIFIGHSMGARVLERAVAQAVVGATHLHAPAALESAAELKQLTAARPGLEQSRKEAETASHAAQEALRAAEEDLRSAHSAADAQRAAVAAQPGRLASLATATLDWIAEKARALRAEFTPAAAAEPDATTLLADLAAFETKLALAPDPTAAQAELAALRARIAAHLADREKLAATLTAAQAKVAAGTTAAAAASAALDTTRALCAARDEALRLNATLALRARRRLDSAFARPADLVLLFNPATEAVVSRQLAEALRNPWLDAAAHQARTALNRDEAHPAASLAEVPPWIISVSSTADAATDKFFPLGGTVRGWLRSYRDADQKRFFRRTAPHVPEFCNYTIPLLAAADWPQSDNWLARNLTLAQVGQWRAQHFPKPEAPPAVPSRETPASRLHAERLAQLHAGQFDDRLVLAPEGAYLIEPEPKTPGNDHPGYWVMRADPKLIQGHNDEFSPRALALVAALLRVSGFENLRPSAPR